MAVPNVPTAPKKMLSGSPEDVEDAIQQLEGQDPRYTDKARRQDLLLRNLEARDRRNLQLSRSGSNLAKQARLQSRFEEAKTEPITNSYMALMLSIAAIFDVSTAILEGIGDLVGIGTLIADLTVVPIAPVILYVLYKRKGIDFNDSKVLVRFWGTVILEFIPILNLFPGYVLNVFLVTSVERIERKTGISLPKK
jgi:hypothetical protein